jgi:hypothetical protein
MDHAAGSDRRSVVSTIIVGQESTNRRSSMIRRGWLHPIIALVVAAVPATALAARLGVARLVNVVAVDGGCLSGPLGPAVQSWDVESGKTYTVTIDNVTECASGGTDPTLGVRVDSSISGNTDIVATRVGPGTYQFDYRVPANARCTMPILHCATAGAANSGSFTRRSDGGSYEVHLRAASFGPACANPQEVCELTPARSHSWGRLKTIYR